MALEACGKRQPRFTRVVIGMLVVWPTEGAAGIGMLCRGRGDLRNLDPYTHADDMYQMPKLNDDCEHCGHLAARRCPVRRLALQTVSRLRF